MEYFCHACTYQGELSDGACRRCRSAFVEEISTSSSQEDPRSFTLGLGAPQTDRAGAHTRNPIEELLSTLLGSGSERTQQPQQRPFRAPSPPANTATHPGRQRGYVMIGSPSNPMTFTFGDGSDSNDSDRRTPQNPPNAPSLSDFLASSFQPPPINRRTRPEEGAQPPAEPGNAIGIGGYIQNLISSLMGSTDVPEMMFNNGQAHFGDYILSQGAFDRFVDELMQNQEASSIIPASSERIEELHRGIVDMDWLKAQDITDCSICKEDFSDGDKYISMPCKHSFHPDCLVPWLNHNGTCPICRYSIAMGREEHERRRQQHRRTQSDDPTTNMPGSFSSVQAEDVD